jgi:hypothetical protein
MGCQAAKVSFLSFFLGRRKMRYASRVETPSSLSVGLAPTKNPLDAYGRGLRLERPDVMAKAARAL